jgi:hypothetical protein
MKTFFYMLLFSFVLYGIPQTCYSQVIKGTYAIKNVQTGMLLRPENANKKDATPIVLYTPVNWECMTWDFKSTGGNTYQLQNLFTDKTLQPVEPVTSGKVEVYQQPLLKNNLRQQWEFIPVAGDIYLIRLKNTDLYLTPADGEGPVNSGVILAGKKKGESQKWTIYEQHPTR